MSKAFVCNKYPRLKIGEIVEFDGGLFVAKTPEQQRLIERNDFYGVFIHDRDSAEENAVMAAVEAEEARPAIRHGRRGTGRRAKQEATQDGSY